MPPKRKKASACERCGSVFANSYNKNRHLTHVHGVIFEPKDYTKLPECKECGITFKSRKGYYKHQRTYHLTAPVSNRNRLYQKQNDVNDYPCLRESLPPRPDYELVKFEPNYFDVENWFYAKVRFSCQDEIHLKIWKDEYEAINNITLRLVKAYRQDLAAIFYKARFRCEYDAYQDGTKSRIKYAACIAELSTTLKKQRKNSNKAIVVIRSTHNHDLNDPSIIKCFNPPSEIREKFVYMFRSNRTVLQALAIHKADLEAEYGEDFPIIAADKAFMPDEIWANKLFNIIKKNEDNIEEEMLGNIHMTVNDYNKSVGHVAAEFQFLSDNNFVVVIVTPLMQRILTIKEAGEIMFVQTSVDVERYGCKVFVFMVNSIAGGLPVGAILTTSDKQEVMVVALEIYKNLITPESFGGRGIKGPRLIMTNDSLAERQALISVFEEASYLVNSFHVLQMTWGYLCDEETGIDKSERQEIFAWIKRLVYSETESELNEVFGAFFSDPLPRKYPNFCDYVLNLHNEKHEWAICMQKHSISGKQNTHNICDAASKIVKDRILHNIKAFSPLQLFEYIVKDMTAFYETKLMAFASGKPNDYLKRKFDYILKRMPVMMWKQVAGLEYSYEIMNNENGMTYFVDTEVGLCSCNPGVAGFSCKHQIFLLHYGNNLPPPVILETPEEKLTIYYLITGKKANITEYSDELWLNLDGICQPPPNLHINISNQNNTNKESEQNNQPIAKVFEMVTQDIVNRCIRAPSYFLPAMQSFIDSYKTIVNSNDSLLWSLDSFGKNTTFFEIDTIEDDDSSNGFIES